MHKKFVDELRWRGMLHDIMPETESYLNENFTIGYIGFDPTADSLGLGNLVQVMTLLHFQQCGHKPIALVGGATGMVGDPSGKSAERNLLSEDILQYNLSKQKAQLEKFLDFNCGTNSAEIVNNYDWFKPFSFLEFIRDVGKHISVNYMLAKDSVKNRLENGMSFTEFTYQLVQGYDFYYLWKNKNVMLQMGGSDQWGNIVTGTELIRRKGEGKAFAITTPLIKKADGTKFGKTEAGNIWLDANKTSPYAFYQFWLNAADEDAENYIKIFTTFDKTTIDEIIAEHNTAKHLRHLQKTLANDITTRVHGNLELDKAIKASEILFGNATNENLNAIDERTFLQVFEGVPQHKIEIEKVNNGISLIDLLSMETNISNSKSEAKRDIQANSYSLNKQKINELDYKIDTTHLINNRYILIQKGKKNYFLVIVE
jgi:tyrosyl-tRNA synthetase